MVAMEHAEATLTGAAERYILGEMPDEEREVYEEHFFSCAECAEEVRTAAMFVQQARPLLLAGPKPVPAAHRPPGERVPASWWAGIAAWFHPLPLGAAAAGFVLAGVVGYHTLVLVPALRQQLHDAERLQTAPSYFLAMSRGDAPVVAVSGDQRLVSLTLSRSFERAFRFYRFDVQDAAGRTVISSTLRAPDSGDELQILLPTGGLSPGPYVLVVAGLESGSSAAPASSPARYPFTFERRASTR
jgi:hypothetical protein